MGVIYQKNNVHKKGFVKFKQGLSSLIVLIDGFGVQTFSN